MIAVALPVVKVINRVLEDYPEARSRLGAHVGKRVDLAVGPLTTPMRVTRAGEVEIIGAGGAADADLTITVPLALLPRLAREDASAYAEVRFSGDSELAAALSTIARNVTWDVEEDLSRVLGDIAAHRLAGGVRAVGHWASEARERVTENVAEYLTHERRAFITHEDLAILTTANETLRDRAARLEARVSYLVN